MLDVDGYPDEASLAQIEQWDIVSQGLEGLLQLVHDNWKWADGPGWHGFHRKGRKLWLDTGGWSGNEDVIEALSKNVLFWGQCWEVSWRGGHYRFRLYKMEPKGAQT